MTRHMYGQGPADWTFSVGTGNAAVLAGAINITFYNQATGGTQYTDLLDASGSPITSVTSSNGSSGLPVGTIPLFFGPDGVTTMWADGGGGYRSLVTAHDGFAFSDDPRFGQLAGVTVAASPSASVGRALTATSGTTAAWAHTAGTGEWVFNVRAYGAKCNGQVVLDGAMTASGTTLTCATSAPFGPGDVGKPIMIKGAAATGVTSLVTTIASYTDSSHVVLANAAVNTVSGAQVLWGTDDTTPIQNAINDACTYAGANAGVATVFFPGGPGYYVVAGPLVSGGTTLGNAQLTLPPIAVGGKKVHLTLLGLSGGTVQHWLQDVPQTSGAIVSFGVFLSDTAQSSSITAHGNPSLLSGPLQPGGYGSSALLFSNMQVTLRDLNLLTTHSANGLTYTAADFSGLACASLERVSYGTAGSVHKSDYATEVQFSAGLSMGLVMPANGGNDNCYIDNLVCAGGYTWGLVATEHTVINRAVLLYCWSALGVTGTYNTSVGASHGFYANQLSVESCTNVMYVFGEGGSGLGPFLDFAQVDTEIASPTILDNTSGNGIRALLGTIRYVGLYTPSGISTGGHPTGLKIVDAQGQYARTVTTTATLRLTDEVVLADTTGGSFTITLISAVRTPNKPAFRNIGTNTLTIAAAGSEKINGTSSSITLTAGQTARLVANNVGWYVI